MSKLMDQKAKKLYVYNGHTDFMVIHIELLAFLKSTKWLKEYSWKV